MLPVLKAIEILESYEGNNNQLLYWKDKLKNKKTLTKSQADYVIKYHEIPAKVAKKELKIDEYFSQELKKEKQLSFLPQTIWVEKLLAESDKAFHVLGKVTSDHPFEFIWVPKMFIVKENKKEVYVDYSRYKKRTPFPYQKEGIETLLKNDKYILADDMGLGKSMVAVIASIESKAEKILIICPATLKINWKREIKIYSKEKTYIVDGKNWEDGYKYYIINYDILKNFHEIPEKGTDEELISNRIKEANFDLIIIDEAHFISNSKAFRTQLVNDLAKNVKRLWLLTGTPITSRPINYYNLLKLIDVPISYNWQHYVKRYCKAWQMKIKGKKIWQVNGASNLDELREKTKPYILRRLKSEVLDLPDKIVSPVYLELESKEYEKEMGEYLEWNEKEGKKVSLMIHISKLMKVRQIIAIEKVPSTIELATKLIENGKKVIIFTNFTSSLKLIADAFGKKAVTLDGKMLKPKRQENVDKFQTDSEIKVFVSNLRAGGVGITLTEAEGVIMNDLSFVPAEHMQGEDRSMRIGQKNNVLIYYPLFENTIEMKIFGILERKKDIINTVMGDDLPEFDEEFTKEVLEF